MFRAALYQAASSGMLLVLTGALVFIGLTLRAEIALAFSFLVLCFWIKRPIPWRQRLLPTLVTGVVLLLTFGAILLCQKPFVATHGRAVKIHIRP